MRILADENIDKRIVDALDAHDVIWVSKFAPSILDPQVLALSISMQRILLTNDKGLAASAAKSAEQSKLGLVFLQMKRVAPENRGSKIADTLLQINDLRNFQLIISHTTPRLLPIPI